MKVVAVIHAKGESTRLPNKNLRKLGGIPLVCHAIRSARNSSVDKIVIDSDSDTILRVGSAYGAEPLKRPPYLARNEITGDDLAYWQAQNFRDYDIIVQVVPTSPFTRPETINECISNCKSGYNSSFTTSSEHLYTWSQHVTPNGEILPDYWDRNGKIKNSGELPPTYIEHTGVYAFNTEYAFVQRRRINVASFKTVLVSHIEKIDINYEEDFEFAEIVWKGLQNLRMSTERKEDLSLATDQASTIYRCLNCGAKQLLG